MILEAVAGTVSPEALRGWGQMLPVPGGEDADALARLEAVMAADPSPAAPLRSWTGRDDEPDSVEQLLHYMEATWQPGQFHAV